MDPLERAISDALIPSMVDPKCTKLERDILSLSVRRGGRGFFNPTQSANAEFQASVNVTAPLSERIMSPSYTNHLTKLKSRYYKKRQRKKERLLKRSDEGRNSLPAITKRAVSLAREKGASNWLTVIPNKGRDCDLYKREFKDAIHLRYDWEIMGTLTVCVCGDRFSVDRAMLCKHGGFIIQRHNELRDLEADLLHLVCNDVETEPVLQEITGETLNSSAKKN